MLARLGDGVVAARDDRREVGAVLGRVGHRADRGQHRPLDRLLHRAIGGVARRAEGLGEIVALGERLGRAADDLREDHAGVAAGAHQRRARDLVREAGAVVGAVLVERLVDRAHGQRQVRAGVAVGHRVDVEVVDPAPVRLDRRPRAVDELVHALLPHALCLTRWMTTSTAATFRPVSALDLVGDLRADGRGDLGEVQAVLDDDVHLDAERARVAVDADPLAAEHAADAGAGGEPDDAVTAERPFGHDLGDRVARDRQPAELQVQRQVVRHGAH